MELYCRLFSLLATYQTTYLLFINLKFLILRDLDDLELQYRALGYGRTVPGRKDTLHVIFTHYQPLFKSPKVTQTPHSAGSRGRILGITPP